MIPNRRFPLWKRQLCTLLLLVVLYLWKSLVNLLLTFRHKFNHPFVTDFHRVFFADARALMKNKIQICVKSNHFFSHRNQNMPTVGWAFSFGPPGRICFCTPKRCEEKWLNSQRPHHRCEIGWSPFSWSPHESLNSHGRHLNHWEKYFFGHQLKHGENFLYRCGQKNLFHKKYERIS